MELFGKYGYVRFPSHSCEPCRQLYFPYPQGQLHASYFLTAVMFVSYASPSLKPPILINIHLHSGARCHIFVVFDLFCDDETFRVFFFRHDFPKKIECLSFSHPSVILAPFSSPGSRFTAMHATLSKSPHDELVFPSLMGFRLWNREVCLLAVCFVLTPLVGSTTPVKGGDSSRLFSPPLFCVGYGIYLLAWDCVVWRVAEEWRVTNNGHSTGTRRPRLPNQKIFTARMV